MYPYPNQSPHTQPMMNGYNNQPPGYTQPPPPGSAYNQPPYIPGYNQPPQNGYNTQYGYTPHGYQEMNGYPQHGYQPHPAYHQPPPHHDYGYGHGQMHSPGYAVPPSGDYGSAYQPYDPYHPQQYYESAPMSVYDYHGYGGWDVSLSPCTGRKKALLIGINYLESSSPLKGCIRDTKKIKEFLVENFGFNDDPQSIVVLTDDRTDEPAMLPTRYNIFTAMEWLVSSSMPGDSLFFYFSGHGGQVEDLDGDEQDGMDETIMPMDYKTEGEIIDDDMHTYLVSRLPQGVKLTALFDSCHSGTALDLPFVYNQSGEIVEGKELLDYAERESSSRRKQKRIDLNKMKQTVADCVSISGCRDDQTSRDAHIEGYGRTGVMSYAFITSLKENKSFSYLGLLQTMRNKLKEKGYSQQIQLSTGHPIDLRVQFLM